MSIKKLCTEELLNHFGEDQIYTDYNLIKKMDDSNLLYSKIDGINKDIAILEILNFIESDTRNVNSSNSKDIWQRGWNENLIDFKNTNDIQAVKPKYYKKFDILRLDGTYIRPEDTVFYYTYFSLFREWFFKKYLSSYDSIYEFGCGSGNNIISMCELYPEKKIFGSDFVDSSVQLIKLLNSKYSNLNSFLFDMKIPDYSIDINDNSVALTMGSMEQISNEYKAFVDFILKKNFRGCISIEPLYELYNSDNLSDVLAMKFHTRRNYLAGYVSYLKELEKNNIITIEKIHRQYFGNPFNEGLSYIIWKPK